MKLTKKDKLNINYAVKTDTINGHKEVSMSSRTVDLVANTYNYFDFDQDVLRKGCASKSISERGVDSKSPGKIKHCMHHDLKQMIAKPTLIEETTLNGMDVIHANSFFPETQKSETELINYDSGMYDQHSIGFQYVDLAFVEKGDPEWDKILSKLINPEEAEKFGYLWDVKEIALYEYSTVAFGANKLTDYLGIKSENKNIL